MRYPVRQADSSTPASCLKHLCRIIHRHAVMTTAMTELIKDNRRCHKLWWTDGGYTGFGGMKEQGKMNWKLLPHTIFQRNTTWRLQRNTGGDFSSDVFVFSTKSVVYSSWSLLGSVNTRRLNERHWVRAHSVTHRLTEIPHNPELRMKNTWGKSENGRICGK